MITASQSEQKLRIEYTFDAPRTQVFEAWINPEYLKQWYAPSGCTLKIKSYDPVSGGSFHMCINNPEYGDCWTIGEFVKVEKPEKIVQRMVMSDEKGKPVDPKVLGMDPNWPQETLLTITFEDMDGKTKMILEQEVNENLAKKTGAYPSWIQMFDRLNESFAS